MTTQTIEQLPPIPHGFKRFALQGVTQLKPHCLIVARDRQSAWAKFCHCYFGSLKPDPIDWLITEVYDQVPTTVQTSKRANEYGEWLVKVVDQYSVIMNEFTYYAIDRDDMLQTARAMQIDLDVMNTPFCGS